MEHMELFYNKKLLVDSLTLGQQGLRFKKFTRNMILLQFEIKEFTMRIRVCRDDRNKWCFYNRKDTIEQLKKEKIIKFRGIDEQSVK